MAQQGQMMAFSCLNSECGKQISFPRPQKSAVYNVTCPHCGVTKKLKLKGMEEMQATPDNSSKAPVRLKEKFLVSSPYKFLCPHCNSQEIGFQTEKPGPRHLPCPRCKGMIEFEVRGKTERLVFTDTLQQFRGKLTLLRKGWVNKAFRLKEGKTTIGRHDEGAMSDISIKNDPTMSRRSVEIEVMYSQKGYTFKLTVLKSTNPVIHNGNPLTTGESISLNFGDTLCLGNTRFRFDKDN